MTYLSVVHIDRYNELYIRLNKIHDVIFNAVCGTQTGCASVQRLSEAAAETSANSCAPGTVKCVKQGRRQAKMKRDFHTFIVLTTLLILLCQCDKKIIINV